jgi:DNA-binding transcriptional regulator of glucitol operon
VTGISAAKEWVIVLTIIALVGIVALAAIQLSGTMGIEERFQHALGISGDAGGETEGPVFQGFSLEGQPLLYLGIVAMLGIICYMAYRQFKI